MNVESRIPRSGRKIAYGISKFCRKIKRSKIARYLVLNFKNAYYLVLEGAKEISTSQKPVFWTIRRVIWKIFWTDTRNFKWWLYLHYWLEIFQKIPKFSETATSAPVLPLTSKNIKYKFQKFGRKEDPFLTGPPIWHFCIICIYSLDIVHRKLLTKSL